jgi:hypothetical protein
VAGAGDTRGGAGTKASSTLADEDLLQLARGVSIGEVVGEEETEVVRRQQIHQRPIAGAAAVVQERASARRSIFPEAIGPPRRVGVLPELRGVHAGDRAGLKDARVVEHAATQMRDQKPRHIGARGREAAGGRDLRPDASAVR